MEQEVSQIAKTATVTLELLEQSGISRHWDKIMSAIRESIPANDEWAIANDAMRIRARRMFVFALWSGEEVKGVVLTAPVRQGDVRSMNIYAIHAQGVSVDDWKEYIAQACETFRLAGYEKLIALTDNDRVLQIIGADGWTSKTYCERSL